jgi:hypothetical protein
VFRTVLLGTMVRRFKSEMNQCFAQLKLWEQDRYALSRPCCGSAARRLTARPWHVPVRISLKHNRFFSSLHSPVRTLLSLVAQAALPRNSQIPLRKRVEFAEPNFFHVTLASPLVYSDPSRRRFPSISQ